MRRLPIALTFLALVCMAFVALLILLPAPPDIETGGKTMVHRHIPDLRDTLDPLAQVKAPDETIPAVSPTPAPVLQLPKQEQGTQIALSPPAPAPPAPVAPPKITPPPAPKIKLKPAIRPEIEVARLPPEPARGGRVDLPSRSDVREWLKSQAWEFLGGVDEAGNILYRFEVWLDAPSNMLGAIKSVSYVYDAPSATPPSRNSDLSDGGFRVRFGGKSCAQKVTVTLTMSDGRSRRAVVDGCRALN